MADDTDQEPRKLTRDQIEKLVRKYNPDITQAAVQGEVDNIERESQGRADIPGDQGTSAGLYQHHNERLAGLKAFATKEKGDWRDPDIQIRYARLEKERDYPSLLKFQQTTDNPGAAEEQFKRVFERPASVLWQHDASGQPITASNRFQFSPYALKQGEANGDLRYMSPGEYLDLTPNLEGKPFASPSGRSLMRSFNRGDQIDEVPSLDVESDGTTARVTDSDGRHRALLAQQQGVEAMPVSVRQKGEGEPKEIVGQSGAIMANDFPKVAGYSKPKDQSVLGRIGQAIMPSAEASELADVPAGFGPVDQGGGKGDQGGQDLADTPAGFAPVEGSGQQQQAAAPASEPDSAAMSLAKGAARGLGETVLTGQELLGKGMQAIGAGGLGGDWLASDAQKGITRLEQEAAADKAAHPWASGIGEFAGQMVLPGGIGGRVARGAGALATGGLQGAIAGLLSPSTDQEHFWRDRLLGLTTGAAAGAAAGKISNAIANAAAPVLRPLVKRLVDEGVELTPGQLAGGAVKRAEDALASIPVLGSAIRAAQRRSIETFNRAAINRSLDDIGLKLPDGLNSGHEAIGWAQDEFSKAYARVIPRMQGTVDTGLRLDLGDILTKAARNNLPQEYQDQLRHVLTTEIANPFMQAGGQLPGDAVQKIGTQLDGLTKRMRISDNPYVQQMGRLLTEADGALDRMMSRQNPALQAAKDKIDAGYAKFKTVQAAAKSVGAHSDGTFTPAQLNRAVSARDRSKDKAAFARGDALLQDLAIASRDVLPQRVPDSGTPERAALMALITGNAYMEPHTGLALGAAAIPYTAPGSRALNWAVNRLSQQPGPTRNALATILQRGAPLVPPIAGSAAAARFTPPAQPPQQQ